MSRADLTIKANDKTITYPASLPVLDYAMSGFVNGDTAAVLQGTPSVTTAASQTPAGGTYSIDVSAGTLLAVTHVLTATYNGDANYSCK